MQIPEPKAGSWNVGIWGFKQCDYLLWALTSTTQCVSRCSDHGTCSGSTCNCQETYAGPYCENKTVPLQQNVSVTGYVDQNVWNYYTFQSSLQTNVLITVTQTTDTGDCDIYVRFDDTPSRWQFDFIHITTEKTFTLTVPNAVGKVIHIGVLGWTASGYSMTVSISATCTPACENGGECDNGRCLCKAGWSGEACNQQFSVLQSGVEVKDNVTTNEWRYYNFVSTASTVVVALNELVPNPNNGFLYLLVSESVTPTLWQYDYGAVALSKSFRSITMFLDHRPGETINWIVGVYGTGYIVNPVSYHLVAWDAK